jgi:DNA repair protein RecO (recombination protein O)
MLEKTRGIVLHQIKYTDSGIVAQLYTRKFGRQSFLIRGMRNRKAGKHNILFQPMFILDLEMYYKSSREIQSLKEFSVSFTPYNIFSDIRKSCVSIFLGEVLTAVLREESPHEEMFDFIEEAVIWFDGCREEYANFHIGFLAGMTSFLGFEPGQRSNSGDLFFDMVNGIFVPVPPLHGNYAGEEISALLAQIFSSSYDNLSAISLNGRLRNEILDVLVRYYSLHLPALRKLNSLEVLKEVFA